MASSGTEKAIKDYQQKNGLQVDGIAGPDTFRRTVRSRYGKGPERLSGEE